MAKVFKLFWILFFLIGMSIPLFYINTAEITEQENRTLAKFPEIKKKGRYNSNYGQEFEKWLGDRFGGRDELIQARFDILYKINTQKENEEAFIGDDGWMFEKSKTVNMPSIKEQQKIIKKRARILRKFITLFTNKDITFYVLLLPHKDEIYQKYWERYYPPKSRIDYEKELENALKDIPHVYVVNTKSVIQKNAEKELMYWKDSDHFSMMGVFVFLKELYQKMAENELKDVPVPIEEVKKKDAHYHVASTAAKLGLPGHVTIPHTYKHIFWKGIEYEEGELQKIKYMGNGPWAKEQALAHSGYSKSPLVLKKFFSIGPCYAKDVYDFLKPLYKQSYHIRNNMGLDYGQEAYERNKRKIREILEIHEPMTVVLTVTSEESVFKMFEEIVKEVGH